MSIPLSRTEADVLDALKALSNPSPGHRRPVRRATLLTRLFPQYEVGSVVHALNQLMGMGRVTRVSRGFYEPISEAQAVVETLAGVRCPCGHPAGRHDEPAPDDPFADCSKLGPCRDCQCKGLLELADDEDDE